MSSTYQLRSVKWPKAFCFKAIFKSNGSVCIPSRNGSEVKEFYYDYPSAYKDMQLLVAQAVSQQHGLDKVESFEGLRTP